VRAKRAKNVAMGRFWGVFQPRDAFTHRSFVYWITAESLCGT